MNFATSSDLPEIIKLFSLYKKDIFSHIRIDYLKRKVESNSIIFENGVVIIFGQYKRRQNIGNTFAQKGDMYLSQIVSDKELPNISSIMIQKFFKYVDNVVWLTVRQENARACRFYEKNGMILVGKTSWKKDTIPGCVYRKGTL